MPVPTFEYQTVTVAANDEEMNDAIATEIAEGWMVLSLTPTGTDIIILFMRTIAAT